MVSKTCSALILPEQVQQKEIKYLIIQFVDKLGTRIQLQR